MSQSFTGAAFAQALASGTPLHSLHVDGMVKPGDDEQHIWFAPGTRCRPDAWVHIPVSLIDRVELLDHVPCDDHEHPFVRLYFKLPAVTNVEGYVFAELLRRSSEAAAPVAADPSFDAAAAIGGPCPKPLCAMLCRECQRRGGKWCQWCRDCWASCRDAA